jgi:Peptidase M30
MKHLILTAFLVFILSACGGGGGAAPEPTTATTYTVIDGLVKGAVVCVDKNKNGLCDSAELQGTTDSLGVVTLNILNSEIGKYPVLGIVPVGAVDADDPSNPIAIAFTMQAPADKSNIISPLTTLVQHQIDKGFTMAQAGALVQAQTGVTDAFANFVTPSDTRARVIAKTIVQMTQTKLADRTLKAVVGTTDPVSKKVITQADLNTAVTASILQGLPTIVSTVSGLAQSSAACTNPAAAACKAAIGSAVSGASGLAASSVVSVGPLSLYKIGGTISGLGTGKTISLQNTVSGETQNYGGDGSFAFSNLADYASSYAVVVAQQPVGQTCTVATGTGSNVTANVASVAVTCTVNTYTIGGSVLGLGTGKTVGLQNTTSGEAKSVASNGSFVFTNRTNYGDAYSVVVAQQPVGQTCSVALGIGSNVTVDVTVPTVTCTVNTFTIGGSLAGLGAGKTISLQNTISGEAKSYAGNGSFVFATPTHYADSYNVVVSQQPVGQTCSVVSGAGANVTANVASVAISCTVNTYSVGGSLTGLGSGKTISIQNTMTGETKSYVGNGTFAFSTLANYSDSYNVVVSQQPVGQTCSVASGAGSNVSTNITAIAVTCAVSMHTIGGSIANLASAMTLQNNGGDSLTVNNSSFTFGTSISYGSAYSVTILQQPANQTCAVASGSGTATGNVSNVVITCSFVATCAADGTVKTSNTSLSAAQNQCPADGLAPSSVGTTAPNTYTGSGMQAWRYTNGGSASTTINVDIGGVAPSKKISLIFSNGNETAVAALPTLGTNASAMPVQRPWAAPTGASVNLSNEQASRDTAHGHMLKKHADEWAHTKKMPRQINRSATAASPLAAPVAAAPPSIGTARTWVDYYDIISISYATTVTGTCTVPSSGRNVVFWQRTTSSPSASYLATAMAAMCGADGGFDRSYKLSGDVWGAHSYSASAYISDSVNLQDINVVFVPNTSGGWGGYFYGRNNRMGTAASPSNQALAFFINETASTNYYISTLVHELQHMVNYYQNSLVRIKSHNTWMEETSAMMSEDIISPQIISGHQPMGGSSASNYGRIYYHLRNGGNLSLNNWTTLSSKSYEMGGSFGAFLNRKYGLNVFKQLITSCLTGTASTNSYVCLNSIIVANGGTSIQDDFARFGASTYANMPAMGASTGYGYPAKTDGTYNLSGFDLTSFTLASPLTLSGVFQSMSQTYYNEIQASGKMRYVRQGVVVPPGTQLMVVVQ